MSKTLTFTTRRAGKFLDIEFSQTPSKGVRGYLTELGFRYERGIRAWRGERNHEAAMDVCVRAVRQSERYAAATQRSNVICENCARAAGRRMKECPWADRFEPVPGWDATPAKLRANNLKDDKPRHIDTYAIHACPLWISDGKTDWRPKREVVGDDG